MSARFAPKPFPPLVVYPPSRFAPTSRFAPIVDSPLVYIRSSVVSNLGLNCLQNSPCISKACKFMFCYLHAQQSSLTKGLYIVPIYVPTLGI